ncbi:MAG TPA: hypothetical protein VMU47_08230 [Caldimonas sp.]|nr:hypothetical protein [Caldimonas sp.]
MTDAPPRAAAETEGFWRRVLPVAAALAAALVGATSAVGEAAPALDCTIRFQLDGWSETYERADGSGIVSCSDGSSMRVVIHARGAGVSIGKSKVDNGTGRLSHVRMPSDVFGSYMPADVYAPIVDAEKAQQVLTNGTVSLALAGKGDGYDLGIGIADFTIRPAD